MPHPQSPASARQARFARSRPAAVALLLLLVALSARQSPPRTGDGWPEVSAGRRTAAMLAAPGVLDAGGASPLAAAMVRTASGDVAPEPYGEAAEATAAPGAASPSRDGYPHPVEYLTLEVDGAPMPLAFMDVSPTGPVNGRAVLILHDRDGAGSAWGATIALLAADGYRVIVPDQVGHGLSGRTDHELPTGTLAAQAAVLLDSIGAPRVAVVGDGLGAQVAVRLAGANAGLVDRMALVDAERGEETGSEVPLHDPVHGRELPVLVVRDGAPLDPLLLGFLGL